MSIDREGIDLGVGSASDALEPLSRFTDSEWEMVPIPWRDPCAYCGADAGTIDQARGAA